jgi:small conductance mechanosensitive channel
VSTTELVMKIGVALAVVAVGWLVGGQVANVARTSMEGTAIDPRVRHGLSRAVRPIVLGVAIVAALEYLDIDLSTVAAMAGAVTLAIGFGLQPAISNLASGALLLTLRPYRDGDHVECANGERGRVLDQGPFAITLERSDGVVVTVPNNSTFQHPVRNHTRMGRRRVDVALLLDPDTELEHARRVVVEHLRADGGVLPDPGPTFSVEAVEAGGLRVVARAWVKPEHHEETASRLTESVLNALRISGVALARPGGPR